MSPPVSVLQVLPRLGAQGGAERSMIEMAEGLREAGIELSAAWLYDRRDEIIESLTELGVRCHHIEGAAFPARVRSLRALVRRERPDIVHTVVWDADMVGRLACVGLPVKVMTSIVNTTYEPVRLADRAVSAARLRTIQALDAATIRLLVDRVHANSESVATSARTRLRTPGDRITVVRRGRSRHRLGVPGPDRRDRARSGLGLGPDDRLVLAVGRQVYQKGHSHLLAALPVVREAHPGAVVWVAGEEGAKSEALRLQIADLGLDDSVRLLGARDDIPDLLAAADVFAFPTLFEGLPGAVIEAMAMEVPIVASSIGPVCELVDENSARLVPPGDAAALALAVIDVLDHPETARGRAEVARATFERELTLAASLEGMVDMYRDVAGAPASDPLRRSPMVGNRVGDHGG